MSACVSGRATCMPTSSTERKAGVCASPCSGNVTIICGGDTSYSLLKLAVKVSPAPRCFWQLNDQRQRASAELYAFIRYGLEERERGARARERLIRTHQQELERAEEARLRWIRHHEHEGGQLRRQLQQEEDRRWEGPADRVSVVNVSPRSTFRSRGWSDGGASRMSS